MASADCSSAPLRRKCEIPRATVANGQVVYSELFEEWQSAVGRWKVSPEELELRDQAVSYSFLPFLAHVDRSASPGMVRSQGTPEVHDKARVKKLYETALQRFLGTTVDYCGIDSQIGTDSKTVEPLFSRNVAARRSRLRKRPSIYSRMLRLRAQVTNLLSKEEALKESLPWMDTTGPESAAASIHDCYSNLKQLAILTDIFRSYQHGFGKQERVLGTEAEKHSADLQSQVVLFGGSYHHQARPESVSIQYLLGAADEPRQRARLGAEKTETGTQNTPLDVLASISVDVENISRMKEGVIACHLDRIRSRFARLHEMVIGADLNDPSTTVREGEQQPNLTDLATRLTKLLKFIDPALPSNGSPKPGGRLLASARPNLVPQLEAEVDLMTILAKTPCMEAQLEEPSTNATKTDSPIQGSRRFDEQIKEEVKLHGKLLKLRTVLEGPYLINWKSRVEVALHMLRDTTVTEVHDQVARVKQLQTTTTHSQAGLRGPGMDGLLERLHSQCKIHKKVLQEYLSPTSG